MLFVTMHLHDRLIMSRYLQANILINKDWSACLADFGLSIFSDATRSMTTNRGGSLYWMAPELLDPDRFGLQFARTPASDVYAFGCVCLEVCVCVCFRIACSEISSYILDDLHFRAYPSLGL